ncbi:MAG: hypothetical protein REI09_01885 [Candidatus Dactylopiibacterium sp.]|nr:hypothetical protein [Candidatus Dactylopiibacterium sp.]
MKRHPVVPARNAEIANQFIRGVVATGLLVGVQQKCQQGLSGKTVLARALQGGTALAAGVAAANALQQRQTGRALVAAALGAAGLAAIEYALRQETSRNPGDPA